MLSPDSPDGRRLVLLLGLAQTISWGTLYFAFTVFLAPMHDTLGWTRPFLAGGFSLGLLVWALCSFLVGRTLERWPARRVMGTGSVLAAASLLAWSRVGGETAFLLLWLPMGVVWRPRCTTRPSSCCARLSAMPTSARSSGSH